MSPVKRKQSEKKMLAKEKKAAAALLRESPCNGGSMPAGAYNPLLGSFHTFESVSSETGSTTSLNNGRYRSIDEGDPSSGASGEYDSASNNGSYSGESEDQIHANSNNGKGKLSTVAAPKAEAPLGMVGSSDKREKTRWKNEKKHQRQKERRAQELKDRCTGYLMSRKLESLAQQLAAMGFSSERATAALIANEGNLEHSVSWLLEGGSEGGREEEVSVADEEEDEEEKADRNDGENLKMDISAEFARMAEWEFKYKYARPDIERAVVSCFGDLDKALELLQSSKKRVVSSSSSSTSSSPSTQGGGGNEESKAARELPKLVKEQPSPPTPGVLQLVESVNKAPQAGHHRCNREEQESHSLKGRLKHSPSSSVSVECPSSLSPTPDKCGTMNNSIGRTTAIPFQPPPPHPPASSILHSLPDTMSRYTPGQVAQVESKWASYNLREPPHPSKSFPSLIPPSFPTPSTNSSLSASWNGNKVVGAGTSSSTLCVSSSSMEKAGGVGGAATSTTNLIGNARNSSISSSSSYNTGEKSSHGQYRPFLPTELDRGWASIRSGIDAQNSSLRSSSSVLQSKMSLPTSIGLFTGWGTVLSRSSVDWNMGSMVNCDYRTIDWSMDASPSRLSSSSSSMLGSWELASSLASLKLSERSSIPGLQFVGKGQGFPSIPMNTAGFPHETGNFYNQWVGPNFRSSQTGVGLQERPPVESGNMTAAKGAHEWTSPFTGRELFTLTHHAIPFL